MTFFALNKVKNGPKIILPKKTLAERGVQKLYFLPFFHAFIALFGQLYGLFSPFLTLFNEKDIIFSPFRKKIPGEA